MTQTISLVSIVGTIATVGTICFVVWTTWRAKTLIARTQAEVQTKLIERIGSTRELVDFLRTPEGRQLVHDLQQVPRIVASDRMLGGIRKGSIVGMLGLGFLAVAIFWPSLGMIIPGFLLLALALGFSMATIVSAKLARSWAILPAREPESSGAP